MKNVVFDLGNVMLTFSPVYMVSLFCDNEEDKRLLLAAIFEDEWDKYDAGAVSHEEKKASAKRLLPERLHELSDDILDKWVFQLTEIPGMAELVGRLKREGYGVFLLSNAPSFFSQNVGFYSAVKLFDGKIFSGDIKLAKPSPEIFNYALKRFGIKAEESVFIDDKPENVETAKSLGFTGYLFDGDDLALYDFIKALK